MVTLLDEIDESKGGNKMKEVYIMGVKVLKMESNERVNGNTRVDDCVWNSSYQALWSPLCMVQSLSSTNSQNHWRLKGWRWIWRLRRVVEEEIEKGLNEFMGYVNASDEIDGVLD